MISKSKMWDLESHIASYDNDELFDSSGQPVATWTNTLLTQAEAERIASIRLDAVLAETESEDIIFEILHDAYVNYSYNNPNVVDYEVVDDTQILPWFKSTVGVELYMAGEFEGLHWSMWILSSMSEIPYLLLAQDTVTGDVESELFYEWTD